jgi:stage II sporulation protein AA (anti-sigma F factor antagonist)
MFIKETKNQLEVFFDGEMDHYQMSLWKEDCQKQILNSKADMVVFDFKAVSFIDSTGIGFILGRYKDLMKMKRKLVLRNCTPAVYRLCEMSGLLTLMKVVQDE